MVVRSEAWLEAHQNRQKQVKAQRKAVNGTNVADKLNHSTKSDLEQMAKLQKKAKKSKYGNKKVVIDGITFDGVDEGKRYNILKFRQQAKLIENLRWQVSFELMPAVKFKHEKRIKKALCYIADFVYTDVKTGQLVVEDVKSVATRNLAPFRIKKHLMMCVLGIEIKEVIL